MSKLKIRVKNKIVKFIKRSNDLNMKKRKIKFSELIGNHYTLQEKMMVLSWMLKTGTEHTQWIGRWNRIGISQTLFDYSANEYGYKCPIPKNDFSWYFDAIFSRAIYGKVNKALKEWREKESIFPGKYRMLEFSDNCCPTDKHPYLSWLIHNIYDFEGKILKKKFAHPDYENRTDPKIISISIYPMGNGWIVEYVFSFKEYKYEPGWSKGYRQNDNESIWEFLTRTYKDIETRITHTKIKL